MCEPTTLTIISLVAMGLSTAGTAYAARESGKFSGRMAEAQASMNNKLAADAKARGEADVAAQRALTDAQIGEAKAAYASGNIDIGGSSAGDTFAGIAWKGAEDAARIRHNAALEAWGYKVQSQQALAQAKADQNAAQMSMYSTILGGASQMAGGISQGYASGAFKKRPPAAQRAATGYQSYAMRNYPMGF
jgi:hypothetical protein